MSEPRVVETKYALRYEDGTFATVIGTRATSVRDAYLFETVYAASIAGPWRKCCPVAVDLVRVDGPRRFEECEQCQTGEHDGWFRRSINDAQPVPLRELPRETVTRWDVRELR